MTETQAAELLVAVEAVRLSVNVVGVVVFLIMMIEAARLGMEMFR
jgi:hypothetical protein